MRVRTSSLLAMPRASSAVEQLSLVASWYPSGEKYHNSTYSNCLNFWMAYCDGWGRRTFGICLDSSKSPIFGFFFSASICSRSATCSARARASSSVACHWRSPPLLPLLLPVGTRASAQVAGCGLVSRAGRGTLWFLRLRPLCLFGCHLKGERTNPKRSLDRPCWMGQQLGHHHWASGRVR